MRTRYVFGHDKKLYPEGQFPPGIRPLNEKPGKFGNGPYIRGDYEPFVSPLNGKVISGRKAYRQHCKDFDVVPTAELKGLPLKKAVTEYKPDRAEIRKEIIRQLNK